MRVRWRRGRKFAGRIGIRDDRLNRLGVERGSRVVPSRDELCQTSDKEWRGLVSEEEGDGERDEMLTLFSRSIPCARSHTLTE